MTNPTDAVTEAVARALIAADYPEAGFARYRRLARVAIAAMPQSSLVEENAPPPKDGTIFYAVVRIPMKWKPYKLTSEQFRKGIKGRWVESNGYGGWNPSNYKPEELPWEPLPALKESTNGQG